MYKQAEVGGAKRVTSDLRSLLITEPVFEDHFQEGLLERTVLTSQVAPGGLWEVDLLKKDVDKNFGVKL